MCALVNHLLFNTRYPVEDDGARSTLDVVDGGLHNGGADRSRDDPAEERGWKGGHGECVGAVVKMGRLVLPCSKMMDVIPDGSVLLRQHHNVIGWRHSITTSILEALWYSTTAFELLCIH
jgi:hypothetical protein